MSDFKVVSWPEIQDLMDLPGFEENSALVMQNECLGIDKCTYLISKEWLAKNE